MRNVIWTQLIQCFIKSYKSSSAHMLEVVFSGLLLSFCLSYSFDLYFR